MTTDEINKLEAGPKLDAFIAERLMGWVDLEWREGGNDGRTLTPTGYYGKGPGHACFLTDHYSTDMRAAWMAAEKVGMFKFCDITQGDAGWWIDNVTQDWRVEAETAPLAICKAALIMAEESEGK
jgi:hypothetical protein